MKTNRMSYPKARAGAAMLLSTAALAIFVLSGSTCGNNSTGGGGAIINNPGGGGSSSGGSTSGNNNNGPSLNAQDHILGNTSAPLTVIEYADFQCPFCGNFARTDFPTIKANYIDTGKVKWVFRHFPLTTIHDRALPAAKASECASDQTDFFSYAEMTYGTTDSSGEAVLTDAQLQQNATSLGLNMSQFNSCYPPGDSKTARVQQDVTSGTNLGVTGTPTFFVGSEKVVGYRNAADFSAILDLHLGS
ncbi:MAG TPA: thioredoxin domain-containing protein [Phycisphaerae bacterium]|nr:thioredoxin domain-containing protein [Phycisphaerae bacterium]